MAQDDALIMLFNEIRGSLRYLSDAGLVGIECRPETLAILDAWDRQIPPAASPARRRGETAPSAGPGRFEKSAAGGAERTGAGVPSTAEGGGALKTAPTGETLDEIRAALGDCTRCRLSENRRFIVFGEGNPRARLLFVGEGPGHEEDRQGKPFVGAAGRLLTKIIQAMGLGREEVYIANIVKCRPPENRNPAADEIEACFPFLQRQIEAIAPEVICALGKFAAQTLLQTDLPISRLRGRFHDYRGTALMPTFHPAFLLRNEGRKRDTWEDVKQIMSKLGLERRS